MKTSEINFYFMRLISPESVGALLNELTNMKPYVVEC